MAKRGRQPIDYLIDALVWMRGQSKKGGRPPASKYENLPAGKKAGMNRRVRLRGDPKRGNPSLSSSIRFVHSNQEKGSHHAHSYISSNSIGRRDLIGRGGCIRSSADPPRTCHMRYTRYPKHDAAQDSASHQLGSGRGGPRGNSVGPAGQFRRVEARGDLRGRRHRPDPSCDDHLQRQLHRTHDQRQRHQPWPFLVAD